MQSMSRDRNVDYKLLDQAVAKAEELWPGADEYKPVWGSTQILVEVWTGGSASVKPVSVDDEPPKRRGRR
jgi:hypothetical protein